MILPPSFDVDAAAAQDRALKKKGTGAAERFPRELAVVCSGPGDGLPADGARTDGGRNAEVPIGTLPYYRLRCCAVLTCCGPPRAIGSPLSSAQLRPTSPLLLLYLRTAPSPFAGGQQANSRRQVLICSSTST